MTHVIAQPCIDVKDKACVDVCPVDCIHGDDDSKMLYINPDDCIDCTLCVDACPVDRHLRRGGPARGVEGVHQGQRRLLREQAVPEGGGLAAHPLGPAWLGYPGEAP